MSVLFVVARFRNFGVDGGELTRSHLEAYGATATSDRIDFVARHLRTLAEVLETS